MNPIDQEPDYVPKRLISRSAAVVVIAIILSIAVTIALQEGAVYEAIEIREPRPARIETTLFDVQTEAEQLRAHAERHLNQYGWVNRQTGVIHVPLDVAIDHYLGGKR